MNGGGDQVSTLQAIVGGICGLTTLGVAVWLAFRLLRFLVRLGRKRGQRKGADAMPAPSRRCFGSALSPVLARTGAALRPHAERAVLVAWQNIAPGRRVLRGKLGRWPKAYRLPGDAPAYLLKARYRRPVNRLGASNIAWIGAGACCLWYLDLHPELQNAQGAISTAIMIGTLSWAGVYLLALNFTTKELRLTVSLDGISWRNASGRKCHVAPDDLAAAECVVLPEHSRAEDERLTMQLKRRNDHPCYRIASEVMVHSGYMLRDTQQLAEIHKDRAGWKAKKLQSGFYAVRDAFTGEVVQRAAAAEALRPLD